MIVHLDIEEEAFISGETYVQIQGTLTYHYEPGEPRVLYYPDGSGHPGAPSSVELIEDGSLTMTIPLDDEKPSIVVDITTAQALMLISRDRLDRLEEDALEQGAEDYAYEGV